MKNFNGLGCFRAVRTFAAAQAGCCAALACVLLSTSLFAQGSVTRPSIIYILADDLGYGDLGCYGQTKLATPNIDALAASGMRFTQHYSGSGSCSPSRSCLLTGRHTGRVRHRENRRFVNGFGFKPEDVTFAEVMRDAGYATAICGKWHLGDRADTTDIAPYHGFDYAYCIGYPYPDRGWEHWPSHVFVNGVQTTIPENGDGRKGRYMDDLYTDAALEFMRRNAERPFVIYLSFQGVHAPMDGKVTPAYADRDWPLPERVFASMLERLDANVGRVVATLRELGLERNTVVFFSSDNGPANEGGHRHETFASNGPLRGHKLQLYEGGVRVPLIASWPGKIRAGATSDFVSAIWDMLPTFAELGGGRIPPAINGISLIPTLLGNGKQTTHDYLYWETQEMEGAQAVRWRNWKALRQGLKANETAPFMLFDLATDLRESQDLAARHPDIIQKMEAMAKEAHTASPITPLFPREKATEFTPVRSAP